MSVAVRKVQGVESVEVSLKKALASIRLRPDNRVTLTQLRQLVKSNGFTSRDIAVTVTGELGQSSDGLTLTVTGTGAVLTLVADQARAAVYQTLRDRAKTPRTLVTLNGVVPEPAAKDPRDRLVVHELSAQ